MNDASLDTALDERYGRTPARRRRRTLLGVAAAAGMLATTIAWVVWVGLFEPGASIESRDLGFAIEDDGAVDVRFEVSAEPGADVSCALQALDERFTIVGWRVVDLPPSEQRTRVFTERVHTASDPVTGLIYRCWLT